MAEPTDSRKLSGIARSIDALFAAPAAPVAPPAATAIEAAPIAPPESEPIPVVLPEPEPMPVVPPEPVFAPVVSPQPAAMPDVPPPVSLATPPPLPLITPAPEPPVLPRAPEMFSNTMMMDVIAQPPPVAEPAPVAIDVPEPSWGAAAAMDASPMELAPAPTRSASDPGSRGGDAPAFAREIDAYVGGDQSARARAETLAAEFKERLELDPLADAVEKLVRTAGDPPSTAHLDFAAAVMNPAVASRLVQRLGQESDEARCQEYFALCRRLGTVMANALKGALTGALAEDVRRKYYDALISMGDAVRPMIEGMVADDNRFLVCDGVTILGEIGGARAVEVVTSALADNDPRVRVKALTALGKLGDAKVGQLVLGFLEDPNEDVRRAAAEASGRLGLQRALRHLVRMLEAAEKPKDILTFLGALGQIGDPGAVPAIEKRAVPSLLSKPTTEVRVAAYRALHAIGSPHARDLVRKTQQDKDPGVRFALRDLAREA